MPETYSLSVAPSCASQSAGTGVLTVTTSYQGSPASAEQGTSLYLLVSGSDVDQQGASRNASFTFSGLANTFYAVEWRDNNTGEVLANGGATISCGSGSGPGLVLDSVSHTDETAAGNDGTATVQASGGTAPLTAEVVELSLSQPATSGQPVTFPGLPASTLTLRVTDAGGQAVQQQVTIAPYTAPVTGCTDEYADNYDPQATDDTTPSSCTYTQRWRSAWGPAGVAVRVAAVAGQVAGYIEAELRVGFRPGHPLAAARPLGQPLSLRATVGPDGYALFVLGPYLRSQLGAPDGAGGYRLDLNSPTAYDADLYVGYELRRTTGELLEHGYALNAAVPDGQLPVTLGSGNALSPFGNQLPIWPGFADYSLAVLSDLSLSSGQGVYGQLVEQAPANIETANTISLPCPPNPLPVAWLAPGGGYGFWIFQGKPALADVVGDGQRYREALTGESRWSERGETRRTYTVSSGPYRGAALAEGLATLARSPQVWVQPVVGGPWVPVTLEAGTFPVRTWGVQRNELKGIVFTEAKPQYQQGQ